MSVFDTINQIRSFRSGNDKQIPRKTIGRILEAGRQAPSPGNVQSLEFIVVEADSKKKILADATGDERFQEVPTAVIVLSDINRMERKVGEHEAEDACSSEAGCAVQNMRLTAREQDISSCWVTGFDDSLISNSFNVPEEKLPRAVVGFCYADSEYEKPDRFGMNSVVFYDSYGNQIANLFDGLQWKGLKDNKKTASRKSKGLMERLREKKEQYL
jgi:nitroreductase